MLENYLRRGVRLKWMPPASQTSVNDGAVIPSPMAPLNPMNYDGMDDQIMANFHANTLGLRVGQQIPYRWLAYVAGRTATMPLGGGDVLTGPMSGCRIATWTDGGQKVAHVGTIDNNPAVSTKVKRAFALASKPAISPARRPHDIRKARSCTPACVCPGLIPPTTRWKPRPPTLLPGPIGSSNMSTE